MKSRLIVLSLVVLSGAMPASGDPQHMHRGGWEETGFWVGSCGDLQGVTDTGISSDVAVAASNGSLLKGFWRSSWVTLFQGSKPMESADERQPATKGFSVTGYAKGHLASVGLYSRVALSCWMRSLHPSGFQRLT